MDNYNETYRDDPTQQMAIISGSTALAPFTGLAAYTALAEGTPCYGVVTHDNSGTYADSIPVSTSTVNESVSNNPGIVVQATPAQGRGFSPDGHPGLPLMLYLHASTAAGYGGSQYGYLDAYWGNTNMGYQDGVQSLFSVNYDTNNFFQNVIRLQPSDGTWYHPQTNFVQTYWTGNEYNGVVYPWTLNKLSFLVPWAATQWSTDPNRYYAYGVSMGGTGLGAWALRQGNFAYLIAQRPVWWWEGNIPSQSNGGTGNYGNDMFYGTGQTYLGYSTVPTWIQNNCGANLPFLETAMGRTDATLGGTDMFTEEVAVINALKACHSGYTLHGMTRATEASRIY